MQPITRICRRPADTVAAAYCTLRNSAVVHDRRVDGRVLSFGTSGRRRHVDLIMFDRARADGGSLRTAARTRVYGSRPGRADRHGARCRIRVSTPSIRTESRTLTDPAGLNVHGSGRSETPPVDRDHPAGRTGPSRARRRRRARAEMRRFQGRKLSAVPRGSSR
ncbi:MAG TPA: DUF3179 domain-containing (seleno)protein [Alphaproteobacteria bacterium]